MKTINFYIKGFCIMSLFLLIGGDVLGQYRGGRFQGSRTPYNGGRTYFVAGLSLNALNYFGDLAPKAGFASTDISFTRPGLGAFLEYKAGPRLFFHGGISWGRIQGDDFSAASPNESGTRGRYFRNLSFRNNIKELTLTGKVMLFSNYNNYLRRSPINPYIMAGIAVFHHNPKGKLPEFDAQGNPVENAGKWVALQPLGTEGQFSDDHDIDPYHRIQLSIPGGVGVNYAIAPNIDLSIEISGRYLFFDYLDDVSGQYVDKGSLEGRYAKLLSDRSGEQKAVISGKSRNLSAYEALRSTYEAGDGKEYVSYMNFGREGAKRGGEDKNDFYLVTSIKLNYIFGSDPSIWEGGKRRY